MVLTVFISSKSQFLDAPLRLAQVLLGISKATVLSIKFRFQFPDASLHLVHGLLASLEGIRFSFIQTLLHVLDLAFKKLAVFFKRLSKVLLSTKLISNTCSINHCLLSLFIRQVCFTSHLIQITMQGLHLRLKLSLGSSNGLVLAGQIRELLIGVRKFLFCHAAGPVSLLQQRPCFLQCILDRVCPTICTDQLVTHNLLAPLFFLQMSLSLTNLLMIPLDRLLSFLIGCICMLQRHLQFSDICFQLLLHAKSFSFALAFSLQSTLHAINGFHEV